MRERERGRERERQRERERERERDVYREMERDADEMLQQGKTLLKHCMSLQCNCLYICGKYCGVDQ